MRKAAAFYWTLPVPWAGFTNVSPDIEEAVKQSRTIAFQRVLMQAWAQDNGCDIVREDAFVELEPDRGSRQILGPLEKLLNWATANEALLLYADFGELLKWRSHMVLDEWLRSLHREGVAHMPVGLQPVMLGNTLFDPASHFSDWRDRNAEWRAGKDARKAAALKRARELTDAGMKPKAIANELNESGQVTATGKAWTADNVRKLLG